jgi:hypothetical protein
MNVNSGKVLDLWDGSKCDDAEIVQLGYGQEMQQRWLLTTCTTTKVPRKIMMMVPTRTFSSRFGYATIAQFFAARDIYVLDRHSADGATNGNGLYVFPFRIQSMEQQGKDRPMIISSFTHLKTPSTSE